MLTLGVYLEDTGPQHGPPTAVPGTPRGPVFDRFDDDGRWTGALVARDVATLVADTAVALGGPAGTVLLLQAGEPGSPAMAAHTPGAPRPGRGAPR